MNAATAGLLSLLGLVALTFGADVMVRGASRLAVHLGVSSLFIGLTVVAYGTSAPEILASVVAAVRGYSGIAVGNVIGSNLANTGLILGGTAVMTPILVASSVLRRELPLMIAVTFLFCALALRLELGRWTGLLFVLLLLTVNYYSYRWARRDAPLPQAERETGNAILKNVLFTALGLGLLMGGAHILVESAVALARTFGISEMTIGVTLVAVGTSLPELATSFVAGLRKEADLVVGNIVGSNLFNILGALGFASLISPIAIDEGIFSLELPALLLSALLMGVFSLSGKLISRVEGLVLLAGYLAFIGLLFL